MNRSDWVLDHYQKAFSETFSRPISNEEQRVEFLRQYLSLLNEFLYERRKTEEMDELNNPNDSHPEWKRITPFLAIWDDYAEKVIGFSFDEKQIDLLARTLVEVLSNSPKLRKKPILLPADNPSGTLSGLTPRQFSLMRLLHALQDFTEMLLPLDDKLVAKISRAFKTIPDESMLVEEESARKLLRVFGGADRNVDERIRYIFSSARIIKNNWKITAYKIAEDCHNDAALIFKKLVELPGLKGKKANMLLRDYYEFGIWSYHSNLQAIDIIPDNRIMRVALRTAIIRTALGKMLNSLLDEFDFQYGITALSTREAFRRVWERTKAFNKGNYLVPYPAGLDELVFRLADGRGGCCRPGAPFCKNAKRPKRFTSWMKETHAYTVEGSCPFESVCPGDTREMLAPYAIQNRTWLDIFTGPSGGGGLRGV